MRRPRALLAGTAGAACLVLIASVAGGTAATPNEDVHYFEAGFGGKLAAVRFLALDPQASTDPVA